MRLHVTSIYYIPYWYTTMNIDIHIYRGTRYREPGSTAVQCVMKCNEVPALSMPSTVFLGLLMHLSSFSLWAAKQNCPERIPTNKAKQEALELSSRLVLGTGFPLFYYQKIFSHLGLISSGVEWSVPHLSVWVTPRDRFPTVDPLAIPIL